ncbi:DUF1420 family protein [Vibrio parahaemolyticus]|nr:MULTISPECIES: DUF1420 family protein [Vibrio]MDW1928832.1 DUF1420 family protein [Vibrio sp. 947]MCR9821526.1 DUF1420 family protein [Vibrio parahaemolyticus]MDF5108391.1 DUF1420 family protein [Vibrio parahaemolyticus]MDF5143297.1 DUF1420 family protein [Vibrio parahaemolyticus]MDF5153679.1 DUF1420 family protein [Vibrio parahaemolyticus]
MTNENIQGTFQLGRKHMFTQPPALLVKCSLGEKLIFKRTLDEYIASPITQLEVSQFRYEYDTMHKRMSKIWKVWGIISTIIGIAAYLWVIYLSPTVIIGKFILGVIFAFFVFLSGIMVIDKFAERRYPLTFKVHNTILTDVKESLKEVTLDSDKLKGSERAIKLYEAIARTGRSPYSFEVDIMRELCRF